MTGFLVSRLKWCHLTRYLLNKVAINDNLNFIKHQIGCKISIICNDNAILDTLIIFEFVNAG